VVVSLLLVLQMISPQSIQGNLVAKLGIDFFAGASIYLLTGYLLKLKEMEFIKLGTGFLTKYITVK